ncbi:gamma-glutamyltransferase family protein [Dietzia lutea]|uniref:Gamma-glutamyltransferase n=1 Tax=Dietzia lutea TaxID=546160 RepID=A0A2S1RCR4_9ACTN|nr:gamma-glutamyltransferase family protein [Dietzia lutea]AWH94096.1 hypothetical protein A6035_17205 [Dietzia lutea]
MVCPEMRAAEVGWDILERGGNAMDAAVAVALMQCVVVPPMAGLGGYGALLYWDGERRRVHGLDFSTYAGSRARPDQWADSAGSLMPDRFGYAVDGLRNDIGYQAVGVPGTADGLGRAHEQWGSLPWRAIVEPAARAAREGFPTSSQTAVLFEAPGQPGRASALERMTATPAAAEVFARDGRLLQLGEVCVQDDLARTLDVMAEQGYRSFYDGEIGRVIAAEFERHGGHVTLEDLHGYRARAFDPLTLTYRGRRIYSTAPPLGGLMICQMLRVLENFELSGYDPHAAPKISLVVEAMKYAMDSRHRIGADPGGRSAIEALLDPAAVRDQADRMRRGERLAVTPPVSVESPDTTHVIVVDDHGNSVSLTHSLGYSAGVIPEGTGALFNNLMNSFNPRPGFIDSIGPGKRPPSSISPTFVVDETGKLQVAIGALGATRIVTAITQTLVNLLDHDMTPVEAVSAPRVDCQGGAIEAEGRLPAHLCSDLERHGYVVNRHALNYDPYFASVQIAARDASGHWDAAVDPRRDGGAPLSTEAQRRLMSNVHDGSRT